MTTSRSPFQINSSICPLCGGANGCVFSGGETPCWCSTTPIPRDVLDRVPEEARNKVCICRSCATGGVKTIGMK